MFTLNDIPFNEKSYISAMRIIVDRLPTGTIDDLVYYWVNNDHITFSILSDYGVDLIDWQELEDASYYIKYIEVCGVIDDDM